MFSHLFISFTHWFTQKSEENIKCCGDWMQFVYNMYTIWESCFKKNTVLQKQNWAQKRSLLIMKKITTHYKFMKAEKYITLSRKHTIFIKYYNININSL